MLDIFEAVTVQVSQPITSGSITKSDVVRLGST